ncbi:SDR family NAD(P)-dependent oxidoreductase [Salicibibacter cibarius]|uniref:SDR family NAD(P)-dependent oxidoreductase n=1 Tax=Salicibibacter cibarius TaxID=2743000 RepID=UPI001FE44F8F|nr:SDR family NAD(P)-dependent oxidoreductase [Salicibibacter cibarius]
MAIITGAGQGLGQSIALEMLDEGKKVVFVDKSKQKLQKLDDDIDEDLKNKTMFLTLDVRDKDAIHDAVQKIITKWGRIDILVNNAGIRKSTKVEDISLDEWESLISVNLTGSFLFAQAVINIMKEQQWGRIINISSFAGQYGPLTSGAHYASSKAGQLALTKILARELSQDGITVNAIAPAIIQSPEMEKLDEKELDEIIHNIPVGRIGEREEVSKLVSYLCSEISVYITGATFDINGGLLMR